jgi:hypothetical protein
MHVSSFINRQKICGKDPEKRIIFKFDAVAKAGIDDVTGF